MEYLKWLLCTGIMFIAVVLIEKQTGKDNMSPETFFIMSLILYLTLFAIPKILKKLDRPED